MDMWSKRARALVRGRTGVAAAAIAGAVLAASHAAAAGPIACGTAYTVGKGDTLFRIADRAYADGWKYKLVFDANRDLLRDAESLEVDTRILVPCLDGSGPATRLDAVAQGLFADGAGTAEAQIPMPGGAEAPARATAVEDGVAPPQAAAGLAAPAPASPALAERGAAPAVQDIRFLTGSGFAPYADQALPDGGLVTVLVSRALEVAAPGRSHGVSYFDDWSSHLDVLLPIGAFEIGFPWLKPDCGQPAGLGEDQQRICDRFAFSMPIQSVEIGYYARIEDPLTGQTSLGALSGKRLCLPQGQFALGLARMGLVAPDVFLVTDLTATQCFQKLAAGEVDVVSMPKPDGDAQVYRLGLDGAAIEIAGLRSTQPLYAIAPKSNPEALAALALVNRGITSMMRSGKWFEIVSGHLAENPNRTAGF